MPIPTEDSDELYDLIACGNHAAAEFVSNIAGWVRLADDIADGDAEDPVEAVAELLVRVIAGQGGNPFFLEHRAALTTPIINGVVAWRMSEKWRHSDMRKTRMFAFVLREAVEQAAWTTALICGGWDHACHVADKMHEICHQKGSLETFEEWEAEI